MKLGIVGLGKMGAGMAERLRRAGHEVVGYARSTGVRDVDSIEDLVSSLSPPRVVWSMVPSGDPTEEVVMELSELLDRGDLIIDGGNSNFRDSIRRAEELKTEGIGFIDAGVSGGVWGLEEGYCLMVGGDESHIKAAAVVFEALAPPGGYVHAGPSGAGHFTKMVHNGIEYGIMQAYAEGYELLSASDLDIDVKGAVEAWRYGSVVRSWLLELLSKALTEDPGLTSVKGWAQDSGEGRWTVIEAVGNAVPTPVISAALFARFSSRQEDSPAMKVVAALRNQFGGHDTKKS